MNIKEYIESGIIESCVLQLATEAEQQEFEVLRARYPEIEHAKQSFEMALEAELMNATFKPSADLKEKILQRLHEPGVQSPYQEPGENKPPISMLRVNVWKWVAAACFVLLAGTLVYTYSINRKYQNLLASGFERENELNHSGHSDAILAAKPIVEKPSVKWSIMSEPTNSSHCMAHIYWDTLSKDTYLLLGNVPQLNPDKQFQLWAMMDDRPVNLGVFNITNEGQLIKMKNVSEGKSFVITIEPKGGSTTPDMKAKYAVSNSMQ